MKLESIQIKNYRSIEDLTINIEELNDNTFTYGLIGVNEAGKSSILKAIGLKDGLNNSEGEKLPLKKDFRSRDRDLDINYNYTLKSSESRVLKDRIKTAVPSFSTFELINLVNIRLNIYYTYQDPTSQRLTVVDIGDVPDDLESLEEITKVIKDFMLARCHTSVFWTAEAQYLITKPINLGEFADSPDTVSIPLKNCFALAGMTTAEEIEERIDLITDSTERESLKDELSESVTKHINAVWKDHPIKITFDISDGLINFHVHDLNAKGKAKTTDQRSDGFGQFISFLLTVSAQNKNNELANTILLIDEPETHLHPRAQEDLLNELITITNNRRNNIVLFATHSNYMIDKVDLSRNYKVAKSAVKGQTAEQTQIKKFNQQSSTYASVTYDVFDIASTDYHNELYSKLHELYQQETPTDEKRQFLTNFDEHFLCKKTGMKKNKPYKGNPNSATLPTYIRNCIHHPDNGDTYSAEELRDSIEKLRSMLTV